MIFGAGNTDAELNEKTDGSFAASPISKTSFSYTTSAYGLGTYLTYHYIAIGF